MKKQWFLILAVFFVTCCSAQQNFDLKNVSYYSSSSNLFMAVIQITPDSVFLFKKAYASIIDKDHYAIVGRENREGYLILYIKTKTTYWEPNNHSAAVPPAFGALIFSLSKDKNELFVLRPFYEHYQSIEDIKSANAEGQFANKYFFTYYSESRFAELTKYPDFMNADKPTVQKVCDDWVNELKASADKIRNAHAADMYGAGTGNDVLFKVLVRNHLSPMANLSELGKKVAEFHIPIPNISFGK